MCCRWQTTETGALKEETVVFSLKFLNWWSDSPTCPGTYSLKEVELKWQEVTVGNWLYSRATRTVAFMSSHFEWQTDGAVSVRSGCCWCYNCQWFQEITHRLRQQSTGFFIDWRLTSPFGNMDTHWIFVLNHEEDAIGVWPSQRNLVFCHTRKQMVQER